MNLEKYTKSKLIKYEFSKLNFWKFDAIKEFDKWSKLNKSYKKGWEYDFYFIFYKLNHQLIYRINFQNIT